MKLVISETVNDIPVVTETSNVLVIADFDSGGGSVPISIVTGKGSLIAGTANSAVGELVVGANNKLLTADSTQSTGIKWDDTLALSPTYTDGNTANTAQSFTTTFTGSAIGSATQRYFSVTSNINGNGGLSGTLNGAYFDFRCNQTADTLSYPVGLISIVRQQNAGAITAAKSIEVALWGTGDGNIGSYSGIYVNTPSISGAAVVTTLYGLFVAELGAASKVTTSTGLYISDQTVAGTSNAIVTNAGKITFNAGGHAEADFTSKTDNYNAIFVDTSNDSIVIMSNALGKVGFYGATAIAKPSAYTQTYSTASKTVPNATASNPPAGGTGATAGAYDTAAHRDSMITSLTNNIADVEALKKVVNSLIDDLQALGLVA